MSHELNRTYLKRPGRGVPPPRSGPPPLVVMRDTSNSHAFFGNCLPGMAVQPTLCVGDNRNRLWSPP